MTVFGSIPGVQLMAAGSWPLASGDATFTQDDLLAAVAASECPSVGRPMLKFGHVAPHGIGDPALGSVANLRVEGSTLVGDYVQMPSALVEQDGDGNSIIASAFPKRSIEAQYDYVCQQGHTHPFAVLAVSFLGATQPAIGSLTALYDLYGATEPDLALAASAAERTSVGRALNIEMEASVADTTVTAAFAPSDLNKAYYGLDSTPYAEWIVEVDLAAKTLVSVDESASPAKYYRSSWTVDGDAASFSSKTEVAMTWTDVAPVAASLMAGTRTRYRDAVAAGRTPEPQTPSLALAAEVNAGTPAQTEGAAEMDAAKIREALGLPADASDEAVLAAASKKTEVAASAAPSEGTVLVDADRLAKLEAAVEASTTRERLARREALLDAAVKAGKFAPARKEHWATAYDLDPEGTEADIASLAAGRLPVTETGHAVEASVSDEDVVLGELFGTEA